MTIRDELSSILKRALSKEGIDLEPIIESSKDNHWVGGYGDYSTNVVLIAAKSRGESMRAQELAERIIDFMDTEELRRKGVRTIEAVSGFINFYLSEEFLQNQVQQIIKQDFKYGSLDLGQGKKVQVEFISANPTGPLTLGNGRGGFTGDVIANILEKVGYNVEREYYVNDVGFQINWILGASMKKKLEPDWEPGGAHELYTGKYILDLAKRFKKEYTDFPSNWTVYGEKAAKLILEEMIKKTIKKMKIGHGRGFDNYFYESSLYKHNEDANKIRSIVLKKLEEQKLTYEKDGATFFKTTKFGDDKDRVIKKSAGRNISEYTYFFSDIMHKAYLMGGKFDKLTLVLGADHYGYQARMNAAMETLGHKGKLSIIIVQLVRLIKDGKEIKVSKRGGNYQKYFELENLIDEVGADVARFFFVSHAPESHMDFDIDLAKKKAKENPVYYVQYAHARISSIFERMREVDYKVDFENINYDLLKKPEEIQILKHLVKFPEVVQDISSSLYVHLLTTYVIQLANIFHRFYERHTVFDPKDDTTTTSLSNSRLALAKATQIVLRNSLYLLGIEAPQKM